MSNHRIVHLAEANLQGSDMSGVNLQEAVLNQANLQEVILKSADLRGANLKNADLSGAILEHAKLQKANFSGANLKSADVSFAFMQEAIGLTIMQILSATWGHDNLGNGAPPSLPKQLANDPDVKEWLAKPHFNKRAIVSKMLDKLRG